MGLGNTVVIIAVFVGSFAISDWVDYSTKCTLKSCDSVPPFNETRDLSSSNMYVVYRTCQDGDRLKKYSGTFSMFSDSSRSRVIVDPGTQYQEIVGFGGALTDSAALVVNQLKGPSLQNLLLSNYYSSSGIEYSLGRVPIASCDFSLGPYSYDDQCDDFALREFSVDIDSTNITGNKISFIQRIIEMSQRSHRNSALKLFASPWAPPAWMTQSSKITHNPRLRRDPKVHKAWALYISKFFSAYLKRGIRFWGVTTQNEPNGNSGQWQGLKFSATEMADFVKHHLGPELRVVHPYLQIIVLDDQRSHLPQWADILLSESVTSSYIDGFGLHWYESVEDYITWLTQPFEKMRHTHQKYPNKFLLATEACMGYIPFLDRGPKLGNWERAERYGFDILHDLNAFAVGWTDWNIALDMSGGPNWAGNMVDAPILVDTQSGDCFYKNPMFYYIGHFSKFIQPGYCRVNVDVTVSPGEPEVEITSFVSPDRSIIVIVMLNREPSSRTIGITVKDDPRGFINVQMPGKSIQTILLKSN